MVASKLQQTMNESTLGLPIIVSLVLHIGIVFFIALNINWSSEKDIVPKPVQAFVVKDYKPVKKVPKQKSQLELEQEAIKVRDAAVERRRQERLAAEEEERIRLNEEKKAEEEKQRLAKIEQEKIAAEKAKAEKEKLEKEKLEKERLEREKAEEARLLDEALKAEEAELEKMRQDELNNELTVEQSRLAQLNTEYKYSIRDKISRNWNKPITTQDNYQCNVFVKQIPGGEIINVEIKSCNGDAVFKQSVQNALLKVKTLPYSGYEEVFSRDIEFTFKPE